MPEAEHAIAFQCMGCRVQVIVGSPLRDGVASPERAARNAEAWLHGFDACLSRFKPDSELTRLNADPRDAVPASVIMRSALRAGQWAAERTGGLVDPTLVGELERVGYADSRAGQEPAPLAEALLAAPPRAPARPHPEARWQGFHVDDERAMIERPPGLRFDSGGIGKGLAADALTHRLDGYDRFAIDCAGDLRVGGPAALEDPYEIEVNDPLSGGTARVLHVGSGGVATSALNSRIWRAHDGGFSHHLLDPSTGRPAWTGLISVTALAPSTLEAETLSKAALLSGPDGAREYLAGTGGLLVHDDGRIEAVGPIDSDPRVRVRLPGLN